MQENVEEILLSLKEQALEATRRHDGQFYRDYLADDAMAVVPFGVFDKAAIVRQMTARDAPFKSLRVTDTRAIILSPESGFVTYKATFESQTDQKTFDAFVTTVYAKVQGKWKGVFYQQTPLRP